jgi:predicted acyl esterase
MLRGLVCAAMLCVVAGDLVAQDETALAAGMPGLAERTIATYASEDRDQYLDNLFRLQLVAGRYADVLKSLHALRELRPADVPAAAANVRWEIYADAKRIEVSEGKPFAEAFQRAFRERMAATGDKDAYRVLWSFGTSLRVLQNSLRDTLARQKGTTAPSVEDAVDLTKKYLSVQAYSSFAPLIAELSAEDDRRRYVIEKDVPVRMPDGGTVCAIIARPRVERRLPTLLNFTIYADPENNLNEVRRSASNGYAGVVGLTRGKGCSPGKAAPYERDGADAAALIAWIAAQAWSDGKVGMYGGSYEGSTAWAAAKRMPKALAGIMTGAPVAPGIDVPMEGSVFWNFVYPWPFYTTNNKTLDNATYNDAARWQRLDHDWYASGRAYRDLEKIDGTPNPIFQRWLAHPGYDAYWRGMIPYGKEFARIGIPVLTTAGYYYGGPGAAVYYFREHQKYRPNAEHYLLIGPYDHVRGHSGTISVLGTRTMTSLAGYELEPAAHIDIGELRYRWFDYVFGKGPRPAILADKVNYMVVGANTWKHASSLAAMANRRLKLNIEGELMVNLADRSDADREIPGGGVVDKAVDTANGLKFVSDPIPAPAEISGLFSGRLDFVTNKKDFDLNIALFELTTAGEYIQLAPFWTRASYNGHPGVRRLLTPGKRQRLDFESVRLMSRQLQPGSRIVAILSVIKETGRQINYGTGKDVSEETIADAKEPLRIQWLAGSYIELPVGR